MTSYDYLTYQMLTIIMDVIYSTLSCPFTIDVTIVMTNDGKNKG